MKIPPSQSSDRPKFSEQPIGTKSSASQKGQIAIPPAGQIVKGTVSSVGQGGNIIIETDLGRFEAKSLTSLEVGRELWFEVVKGGQVPLLSASLKLNSVDEILRFLIPGMRAFTEHSSASAESERNGMSPEGLNRGASLLNILSENSVGRDSDPIKLIKLISWLNGQVKGSAANHAGGATELAAVKISDLVGMLEKLEPPGLQKLVRLLEAHSTLNSQPETGSSSKAEQFFIFPCFFAGESGWGEWLFSFDKEKQNQESKTAGYSLSFYLSMSQLGDVHLKLFQRQGNISGVFSFESKEAAAHVRENLPSLIDELKKLYDEVNFSCAFSQKGTLERLKSDMAARSGVDFSLLDVTA